MYLLVSLLKALASLCDVVGDLGVDDATGAFSGSAITLVIIREWNLVVVIRQK